MSALWGLFLPLSLGPQSCLNSREKGLWWGAAWGDNTKIRVHIGGWKGHWRGGLLSCGPSSDASFLFRPGRWATPINKSNSFLVLEAAKVPGAGWHSRQATGFEATRPGLWTVGLHPLSCSVSPLVLITENPDAVCHAGENNTRLRPGRPGF